MPRLLFHLLGLPKTIANLLVFNQNGTASQVIFEMAKSKNYAKHSRAKPAPRPSPQAAPQPQPQPQPQATENQPAFSSSAQVSEIKLELHSANLGSAVLTSPANPKPSPTAVVANTSVGEAPAAPNNANTSATNGLALVDENESAATPPLQVADAVVEPPEFSASKTDAADTASGNRINGHGKVNVNEHRSAVGKQEEKQPASAKEGLESSSYAKKEREYTRLMNELRACGVSLDVDVPRVAIIGNQSAGKSSVIEGISGITLPRSKGTCTRCPMEVRLAPSNDAWRCVVKLRFERDEDGSLLDNIRELPFGEPILDKANVEDRLRRAQLAILNPSTDAAAFLSADCDLNAKPKLGFSTNLVCIDITGPGVISLSFVDLPGFISNAAKGEESSIDLIRNLAKETIKGGNCLILLTLTMTEDIQTQYGAMLSREVDERGERTIGVLTKPDAVQEGDLHYWQDVLLGNVEALRHGYFVVKNPSTKDLDEGITYEEARHKERMIFQTPDWLSLPQSARARLSTEKLVQHLSHVLESFIRKRMPKLTEQIRAGYDEVQARILDLPTEVSEHEAIAHVDRLCRAFAAELQDCLHGSIEHPTLIQNLRRQVFAKFRDRIRLTVPVILPVAKRERSAFDQACAFYAPHPNDNLKLIYQKLEDIFEPGEFFFEDGLNMENRKHFPTELFTVLNLDDIQARKEGSITRELPGNVPYAVKIALMQQSIRAWRMISEKCFQDTKSVLLGHVDKLVKTYFGQYEASSLQAKVKACMTNRIDEAGAAAFEVIMQVLAFEESIDTANHHYFTSTRDRILEALQARRAKAMGLDGEDEDRYNEKQAISLLRAAGYDVNDKSLTRLTQAGLYQEELELCAEMLAYWKLAFKRICDLVPGLLDVMFAHKVADEALTSLYKDLGIQQRDAMERCLSYLEEDLDVVTKRNELKARRARLQQGLEAIRSFETRMVSHA
ncbi:hypothetical protein ACQY0O_007405 [Thecaphora frezii]